MHSVAAEANRDSEILDSLGVPDVALPYLTACQRVGGAVAHLGCDGLIVPSARRDAALNLVIYPDQSGIETARFEILDFEIVR